MKRPVRARLIGGTDVKWSPPVDYLRYVKLPLLRECGLDAAVDVVRRGFYPAGGGELVVDVDPSTLSSLVMTADRPGGDARGSATETEYGVSTCGSSTGKYGVHAVASNDLEAADVAERMAETAIEDLEERGVADVTTATTTYADTESTGAVLTIVGACRSEAGSVDASGSDGASEAGEKAHPRPRAGFAAYGEQGTASEDVAHDAVTRWCANDAPIDAHLGDQLVVWLALAGGRIRIPRVTDHVRTNVDLVRAFGYDVSVEPDGRDAAGSEAIVSSPRR